MRELEEKIAAWREEVKCSLPDEVETVRELEEHLRDDVQARCRAGMDAHEALAAAIRQIGEPAALAQQFVRARRRWLPASGEVRAVVALIGLLVAALLVQVCAAHRISGLLLVHVLIITSGYLMVLGAGLLGLWTLATSWRPCTPGKRREMRVAMFGFTVAASVLVPVGMILGMFWAAGNLGRAWSWQPLEKGALLVLVSSWVLLLVQTKLVVSERARAMLALLGGISVVVGFAAGPLTNAVPVGWLGIALIASQGAVILLRHRDARERAS